MAGKSVRNRVVRVCVCSAKSAPVLDSQSIPTQLRKAELDLIGPLLEKGRSKGVIGERARGSLARQPSSVYWTALVRWGLFLRQRPQGWYHTHFTGLLHGRSAEETADDPGVIRSRQPNWHPDIAVSNGLLGKTLGFTEYKARFCDGPAVTLSLCQARRAAARR